MQDGRCRLALSWDSRSLNKQGGKKKCWQTLETLTLSEKKFKVFFPFSNLTTISMLTS